MHQKLFVGRASPGPTHAQGKLAVLPRLEDLRDREGTQREGGKRRRKGTGREEEERNGKGQDSIPADFSTCSSGNGLIETV